MSGHHRYRELDSVTDDQRSAKVDELQGLISTSTAASFKCLEDLSRILKSRVPGFAQRSEAMSSTRKRKRDEAQGGGAGGGAEGGAGGEAEATEVVAQVYAGGNGGL